MKKRKERIALTISPEIKRIYDDTADALSIPTSKLIVQILSEASPSIKKMGLAVEKAKKKPFDGLHDLSLLLDEGGKQIDNLQIDIEDQINSK